MKPSFKTTLCILSIFFIGTLLSHPPASTGRGDLRQLFAIGLKDHQHEERFVQKREPTSTLEVLKQKAMKVTNQSPSICIVGAGISGLTAAYRLNQLGFSSYVYEGSERPGGRIDSAQFPNGQIYERAAELISESDLDLITLVKELNLTLYEQFPGNYPPSSSPFIEVVEYPDPTFTAELDSMNVNKYIDSLCSFLRSDGNGSKSYLAQFFKARPL